jgi:hypothetical protein
VGLGEAKLFEETISVLRADVAEIFLDERFKGGLCVEYRSVIFNFPDDSPSTCVWWYLVRGVDGRQPNCACRVRSDRDPGQESNDVPDGSAGLHIEKD